MDADQTLEALKRRLEQAEAIAGEAEERLRRALEAGQMEHWEWDPETDRVRRSNSLADLDGLNPDEAWHSAVESFVLLHADDRERHVAMVEAARHGRTGWHTEVRIISPETGETRWMEERAAPTTDPISGAFRIVGFTWDVTERKRSEAALRASEARFQQFANASSGALWIRDATSLDMEYISPAAAGLYGTAPDVLLGEIETWAAMILPDDRLEALSRIEDARQGQTVVHEFRIQRASDRAFRWIRDVVFPLRSAEGGVERVGGIFEDITEAKLAIEHQGVLLAELQHRVRNIMAIIRSITARTGERAESVPDYAERIAGRLMALSRVQALITQTADGGANLQPLIQDEIRVQAEHEGQYDLAGPDVLLSAKAAEVLTLAIHELSTNALKYGALAGADGRITVRWDVTEREDRRWLVFDWYETGAPSREGAPQPPRRRGFGTELIEGRIPYELGGMGRVVITSGGAQCHLEFPLQTGASVLETKAPQKATVYGGALDMTGEARLDGATVLVVEDEYYIATDTARALEGAGAHVVGPVPNEYAARSAIEQQRPDAVVVDINLGSRPSFKLAQTLRDRDIPFVFVTGYDRQVIPDEFQDVERLEKPIQLRHVVGAVSALLNPAA